MTLQNHPRNETRVPHAVTAGKASVLPAVSAPHLDFEMWDATALAPK